jgi:hypothetical protein
MKKIIHHIRKQPEEVRRHVLHILTVACSVILLFLWVYSLGATLANPGTQTKMSQDLKPFSALKSNIVGGYDGITEPNLGTEQ